MTEKKKSLETQKALRFVVSSQIHYLLQKKNIVGQYTSCNL